MDKRRFGRSGHESTVAIFGGAALWVAGQAEADRAMEQVIAAGVNHIDVAPSYGNAEELLGPWMERERSSFFLGCKTTERVRAGADAELHRSLKRLRVDSFDLYQLHSVNTFADLDQATARGGALEAVCAAREQGLTRFIGITGHGLQSPSVFLEALRRFDFDSVLFPINAKMFADENYRRDAQALMHECQVRQVGIMAIKSIARGLWGEHPKTHTTWYEPFADMEHIQPAVNFALSQPVTSLCCPGDLRVLPLFLAACGQFTPMDTDAQTAMIGGAARLEPLFT